MYMAVSNVVRAGNVTWFDGTHPVTYQVVGKTDPVVSQALRMFCDDMELVTSQRPVPLSSVRSGGSPPSAVIRIVQGHGNDDGFRISIQDGQLVVEGHNARGTAYGLLELSRMAGVSPWVWWGDVCPAMRHDALSLPDTFLYEHTPSVKYRGIFINDEDWSLRQWSKDDMGPQTYRRLFELLLRLRANTIWPAMHDCSPGFFTVKGNKAMADSFGIVVGSSHCEPLLRNNVAEWNTDERGPYNYIANRSQVQRYWAERLQQVRGSEVLFTIGMRGIHDGSMEGVKTPEEKLNGLQQVIDDQRQLIRKHYLSKSAKPGGKGGYAAPGGLESVPQVFIPYKEVLEIMESGLRVPDDVTLMWCDDNYGYLTRLPDAAQQQRSGGGGVYYHLSYWGRPHDYLWLTTTQPGLICSEMRTAYDHNCRRLWIANVHDPKVAAYDLELFLDMAWDINSVVPYAATTVPGASPSGSAAVPGALASGLTTVAQHLERWLCAQFGPLVGHGIAPAMRELYRLNAIRKPEFMGWTQVELDKKKYPGGKSVPSTTAFTQSEAYERMAAFARIEATVDTYKGMVPERCQDAYFAAVLYPVHASAAMTRKMLSDSVVSHRAYEEIQQLTEHYNTMNGGKWHGLMSAAPRNLPVFGNVRTHFPSSGEEGCPKGGVVAKTSGEEGLGLQWISRNASEYISATDGVHAIQMLGHSMNAVAIPKGGEVVYEFDTGHGDRNIDPSLGQVPVPMTRVLLYTAMIPTQPSCPPAKGELSEKVSVREGDLRYQVTLDDQPPVIISLKEKYRSESWKQNVLRGQALKQTPVKLSKGRHTLKIKALDDHIIFDQWMLDFSPAHKFYVIPY